MDAGRGFPAASEALSTSKSRFGYQENQLNFVPPARATPIVHKSASAENVAQISAVRSISQRFDEDEVGGGDGSVCQSFDFSEDPSFWKDNNVQVIIRVRPLSSTEISLQGYSKCIKQENSQTVLWTGHPESRFTFDFVADENVSQENLFKVAGLSMVENCIGGYNSCMFAYGQTGSGKTHTMLGDIEGGTRRHSVNCGITPRVFEHLFSRIQKEKEDRKDEKLMFSCKCSFLEIYNEQILDLLDPSSSNLHIREDIKKGVYVENLKELEVKSSREVLQHLIQGAANRKVASTNMNRASSRSHSVFTCIIESQWESQGVTHHRFARLNLVDLAGSERQKSSGAEGERLKEATNINKSLSTLGLVIMNLVSISNGKSLHVPYRDSKLTFLLQDSLGGNSKTIIIANISPASCCTLETMSTLKFAQRAKFIKNNAIVNEDSSGDVIAMRLQIQQLKKEIARLRGYTGGADNQDIDTMTVTFPGSPGSFKWEGLGGLCSPLTVGKGISQKKDYEVTLVGAFKREKEKDLSLQALAAENQAAMQLAKQREDEIQGLKMRLRFREAGIKRLEAVVSGKISAETYLIKEKEENLKEIDVLKTQVDRNQEATRFAMENLRLKEEIRRLKSFYEEGEREFMDEQIKVLQSKLLEALDWKLMHESNPSTTIANSSMLAEICNDDNLLISNQELRSPRKSFINEENEFLHMQVIQNQAELDALSQKLELCLKEKEKLESHVNELILKLEAEKSHSRSGVNQIEPPLWSTDNPIVNTSDQTELKTMVDAIAAASQREAEAHEKVIRISNENDELRMKVNILIEDNKNLIEMYEKASAECANKEINKSETTQYVAEKEIELQKMIHNLEHQLVEMHEENDKLMGLYEEAMQEKASVECANKEINKSETTQYVAEKEIELQKMIHNLEHQLVEMHEENDKLMGLYEEAMQEKDELKRMVSALELRKSNFVAMDCPERLVMIDEGMDLEIYEPTTSIDKRNLVRGSSFSRVDDVESQNCIQEFNLSAPEDPMEAREGPDSMDDEGEGLSTEKSVGESSFYEPTTSIDKRNLVRGSSFSRVDYVESQNCIQEFNLSAPEDPMEAREGPDSMDDEGEGLSTEKSVGESSFSETVEKCPLKLDAQNGAIPPQIEAESSVLVEKMHDHLNMVKSKVGKAAEQLSDTSNALASFSLLEKLIFEADNLSREIELLEDEFQVKQNQLESNEVLSSDIQKRTLALNKLSALKYTISSLSASLVYFEDREATTRVRRKASQFYLEQKKREMGSLQILKNEMDTAKRKIQNSEDELRNKILSLKSKLEEENKKQENDKVLFAIDNVERIEPTFKTLHLGGKATELLKSEEEKTKLQAEMKLYREKLGSRKREVEEMTKKSAMLDTEIKTVELEIKKAIDSVEEMDLKFKTAVQEKQTLLETREIQQTEIENRILDYQECVYSEDLKAAEKMMMEEELEMEFRRIQEKQIVRTVLKEKAVQLLKFTNEDLKNLGSSIVEARLLLEKGQ